MIVVDWGTSSFRAYRLGPQGEILARREAPAGILAVKDGAFAATLLAHVGEWLGPAPATIVMSGMIGSRQGWHEAPYVQAPAGAAEIAAAMVEISAGDRARVWIAPGVITRTEDGYHDVMRGEETQLLGALPKLGPGAHTLCMPGTHSKWVEAEAGRILGFRTHMTGEAFAVLRSHSILGRTIEGDAGTDAESFRAGVLRASSGGGLLHHLFEVRAQYLAGALTAAASADYLSGVLIGHELAAERPRGPVHLLGSAVLVERYRAACEILGILAHALDPDTVVPGLFALARARQLA